MLLTGKALLNANCFGLFSVMFLVKCPQIYGFRCTFEQMMILSRTFLAIYNQDKQCMSELSVFEFVILNDESDSCFSYFSFLCDGFEVRIITSMQRLNNKNKIPQRQV